MKQLFALFWARNKEFYRDRGSLIWAFVMPPLILGVVALAFSRGDQALFNIGLYGNDVTMPDALRTETIKDTFHSVAYDDLAKAIQRVQYHQLDLLIQPPNNTQSGKYWINQNSQKGKIAEQLLLNNSTIPWQKEPVTGREIRYVDWAIPGIMAMNLMFSGLFGIGYVIVRYRKNGVLKRLQATPITPLQFLSAQVLSRLCIMIVVSTLVFTGANLLLDFVMLGSYLELFLVAVLGMLSILSLGLIVAARLATEELANGLLNLITFPMMLLSEIWFSLDGAPAWMHGISSALPLTHLVKAARAIMLEGATLADISVHLIALTAMTAVFLAIAAWLFKWRE